MSLSKAERKELRRRAAMDADEERHSVWKPSSNPSVQKARSRWARHSYNPEYLGLTVLSLIIASLGVGTLAFQAPPSEFLFPTIALPLGLAAFVGGLEVARFYGPPVVPPDVKAREFRKRLLKRRLIVGGPGLLLLVAGFGALVYLYGVVGFALGSTLWAVGLATGSGAYAVTSRIRYCPHCRYFITFRRFEGHWACTTCGRPLEQGGESPGSSVESSRSEER